MSLDLTKPTYQSNVITIKLIEGVGEFEKQSGSVAFNIKSLDEKLSMFEVNKLEKRFRYNEKKLKSVIRYYLSENSTVSIDIYDITGKLINKLVNQFQTMGNQQVLWNTSTLSKGIYFCKLSTGNGIGTKKIIKVN